MVRKSKPAPLQQTFSFAPSPDALPSEDAPAPMVSPESPELASSEVPLETERQELWPLDGGILGEDDSFLLSLRGVPSLEELGHLARDCRRCQLRQGCRGVVFGEGNPRAGIMFVGEGPGQTEDELGRPFVGRAGQLLDRWLHLLGWKRQDVYITNVVKCRPPGNRTPTGEEMRSCWPILRQQIRLIRPRVLVCLGSPAMQALVHPAARVTRWRGSWLERGGVKLLGTFHPAAVLRDESKQRAVLEDLRKLREEYLRITSLGERNP